MAWQGDLPDGLTFVDDSNGDITQATISGTPAVGMKGSYPLTIVAAGIGCGVKTNDGQQYAEEQDFALTVNPIAADVPIVDGISPSAGKAGTAVTITGSGFTSGAKVQFGAVGAATSVTVNSSTSITATVPTGPNGPVDVSVQASGLSSPASPQDVYTYEMPPQRPDLIGAKASGEDLLASWAPNPSGDNVGGYLLRAKMAKGYAGAVPPGCATPAPVGAPGNTTAALIPVCASVPYTVTATATNSFGSSPASAPSPPVASIGPAPPSAPTITSVEARTESLLVSWLPPPQDGGSPAANYVVTTTPGSGSSCTGATIFDGTLAATVTQTTISGLVDGCTYQVSVVAVSATGQSSPSASLSGTPSATEPPGQPAGLQVIPDCSGTTAPDCSGSLNITWQPPVDSGSDPVTGYVLTWSYVIKGITEEGSPVPLPATADSDVLTPSTSTCPGDTSPCFYTVSVVAESSVREGEPITSSPVSPTVALSPAAPDDTTQGLTSNTVALNQTTANALVSDVDGTLTWPQSASPDSCAATPPPPEPQCLQPDQVIEVPSSPQAPQGLMAVVQTVTAAPSGDTVVATTPAKLGQAFSTFSFSVTEPDSPDATAERALTAKAPGLLKMAPALSVGASVSLPINVSAGPISIDGQVGLAATASVNAAVEITQWCWFLPCGFQASASAGASITASESISITLAGSQTWNLATLQLPVIAFSIGPVPIVIDPTVNINFGVSGKLDVSSSAQTTIGGSLNWSSSSGFSSTSDNSSTGSGNQPFIIASGQATASLSLQPQVCLDFILCGDLTASGNLQVGVQYPASSSPLQPCGQSDLYLCLCPGISVTAGLSIDVILWSATVNFSLFNETLGCYSVPGSQQPGLTITESSTHLKPTSPGNTATFKAKCPGCQDLQWQIIGGIDGDSLSSSSRPRTVLTVADVAPRTLTVQATATTSSGQTLSDQVTVDVGDVCTLTPPADLTVDANELTWSAPSAGCSSQVSAYRVVESQYSQGQCQSNHLLVDACTSPFGTDVFDVPATTTSLALPTRYAASVQVYAITNKGYASSPATAPLVYDTVSESVVPTAISSGASAQVVVTVDSGKTPVSGDTLTLSAVDPSTGATCGNFTSISDPTGQTGNQGATDADGTITATLNVESVTVQTDCDIEAVEQETAPGTGSEATQTITISP